MIPTMSHIEIIRQQIGVMKEHADRQNKNIAERRVAHDEEATAIEQDENGLVVLQKAIRELESKYGVSVNG